MEPWVAELEGVEKCQTFVFSLPDLGNRELDKIRAEAHGAFTSKVRALMVFAAGSPPGFRLSLLLAVPAGAPVRGSGLCRRCPRTRTGAAGGPLTFGDAGTGLKEA